jgi:hypothetical protein
MTTGHDKTALRGLRPFAEGPVRASTERDLLAMLRSGIFADPRERSYFPERDMTSAYSQGEGCR